MLVTYAPHGYHCVSIIASLAKDRPFNHSAAMEAPPTVPAAHRPWWETRAFVAALIIASMIPLLYPPIPPLVDLPGHMGRYRVELGLASSPHLQQYFTYHWSLMGNLGLDLLIVPMAKLFGLELGTKLLILAILKHYRSNTCFNMYDGGIAQPFHQQHTSLEIDAFAVWVGKRDMLRPHTQFDSA